MSIALLRNMTESSSAMASSLSDRGDYPSAASSRKPGAFPRSNIDVNLSNHYASRVYTSSSPVSGNVTITTRREVPFNTIQILLMGSTKTRIEGINAPHDVTHTFLKMTMPIPESTYPTPRVLENGHTYTIPFNFVIPSQLTINACNHSMLSSQLQDHHVRLPPSMGGNWAKDDMAPHMARVEYEIKARVLRLDGASGKHIRIMEAVQPLNVLPASVEEPPLNITEQDQLYVMAKSKTVRKNLLSSKLGRLTARAVQPSSAVLGADGQHLVSAPTAQVELVFEPAAADVPPPKVTGVTGKITAHTYYSSGTIPSFPNLGEWREQFAMDKRGAYSTSAALPALPTPMARWTQQLTDAARRDSGYSSDVNGSGEHSDASSGTAHQHRRSLLSSKDRASPIYHTAALAIPLALPVDKKTLIPTFHSCIASRVYTLTLALQIAPGPGSSATTTLTLTMPLQMAVEGPSSVREAEALPTFEEVEADEHLRPRVIAVPEEQYREGSRSVLPGYA